MTVKELMDYLTWRTSIYPDFNDFDIKLAGWDANGERSDIHIKDVKVGSDEKTVYLFDY